MIAKIGKGSNMYGAILYNQQKVDKENGTVLLLNKIPDTVDGRYSVAYFNKCFEPYLSANIKTEKTVRHLPKYYNFSTMGSYNALLSLFNITAEEVKGERNGQTVNRLVYVALDENGNKVSNPFKASLFGKDAGAVQLQKHFEQSKEKMKTNPERSVLKNTVELAIHTMSNETEFKKQLTEQGINTVVRRNNEGRIYGMTFIDHESRSVWNGSQLDRNLSVNLFNDWWNNGNKPELKIQDSPVSKTNTIDDLSAKNLFEFISQQHSPNSALELFSLLPDAQGEDYEEEQFANRMKKKKKEKRL